MKIYTFETKGWGDYGETHFNVVAETEKEAWKKAMELEDRNNIVGITRVYYPITEARK